MKSLIKTNLVYFKVKQKRKKTLWEKEDSCLRNVLFFSFISDNIDLNAVMSQQNLPATLLDKNIEGRIEEEDPEGTVKPS